MRNALEAGVVVVVAAAARSRLPAACRAVVHRVDGAHVLRRPRRAGAARARPGRDVVGRPALASARPAALQRPRHQRPDAVAAHARRRPRRRGDHGGRGWPTGGDVVRPWATRRRGASPTPAAVVGATTDGPFVDRPLPRRAAPAGRAAPPARASPSSCAPSSPRWRPVDAARRAHLRARRLQGRGGVRPVRRPPPRRRPGHRPRRPPRLARPDVAARRAAAAGAPPRRGRGQRPRGATSGCGPRPCEPVPRLVVVVDELRALVEELPDFVTGLVRLAALGRSLGVHLVLATQRPSGAVSAEVQANVSLRIAFRVRDRADSVDVLDDGGRRHHLTQHAGAGARPRGGRGAGHLPGRDGRGTAGAPRLRLTVRACRDGGGPAERPPGRADAAPVRARRHGRGRRTARGRARCEGRTGSSAGTLPGRRGWRHCLRVVALVAAHRGRPSSGRRAGGPRRRA